MEVSSDALKELEARWRKNNPGKEITQQELLDMAQRLLRIVNIVYKPIPYQNINDRLLTNR